MNPVVQLGWYKRQKKGDLKGQSFRVFVGLSILTPFQVCPVKTLLIFPIPMLAALLPTLPMLYLPSMTLWGQIRTFSSEPPYPGCLGRGRGHNLHFPSAPPHSRSPKRKALSTKSPGVSVVITFVFQQQFHPPHVGKAVRCSVAHQPTSTFQPTKRRRCQIIMFSQLCSSSQQPWRMMSSSPLSLNIHHQTSQGDGKS